MTEDRRAADPGQPVRAHAALVVDRHAHEVRAADAEQRQQLVDRGVHFGSHHHGHFRRAAHALLLDVPPGAGEYGVAGSGEAGEVRGGRTDHERTDGFRGEPEEVPEPADRRLVEERRGWRARETERILVPGRRQDVRGDRRGERAAVTTGAQALDIRVARGDTGFRPRPSR